MNALFAASRYLSRGQKVVLVDRRAAVGGMWLSAYDYVRLHQPHPFFTAGNIAWTSGRDRGYLASRSEVVAHLTHCLETLGRRVQIQTRFGHEYRSHVDAGSGSDRVVVQCSSPHGAQALRVRARKLVIAFGANLQTKQPLALSSTEVRSVSPDTHDLLGEEMRASDAPVYIAGGGKTAMDTAYALLQRFPSKRVSLFIGSGTMFGCRDQLFPKGLRRLWSGSTPLAMFLDMAQRYDGRNEREVLSHLRSTYAVALRPDVRRFMFGLLSRDENSVIAARSREIVADYLSDVVEEDGRPTLLLKSGERRPIEPGSWIVNCTGYLGPDPTPYEPFVSPSGKVIAIKASSAIHILSTSAAYLTVHLSYLNKLHGLPLYEADLPTLYEADRDAFSVTTAVHLLYNTGVILDAVPRSVFKEYGVDLGRWYPAPRRILDGMRFLQYSKRNPDHLRRTLDTIRDRFRVRCGPLQHMPVTRAAHT